MKLTATLTNVILNIYIKENFGKCKFLHTGHWNEDAQYTMGGTVLNTTLKEMELGLTISADIKVPEQCGIAAAKGNQILN